MIRYSFNRLKTRRNRIIKEITSTNYNNNKLSSYEKLLYKTIKNKKLIGLFILNSNLVKNNSQLILANSTSNEIQKSEKD